MEFHGKLVDIHNKKIYSAAIKVDQGKITSIEPNSHRGRGFILPGLIDAHIHIESSLIPPSEFARIAIRHGTIATVSDPHEIANVLGISGVEYMLDDAQKVPFRFFFGAPSCVPLTEMETSGAHLGPLEVRELLENPKIHYLSEVLNYSDILCKKPELLEKIATAKQLNKPIDGHAPGLYGEDLKKYRAVGIETDHESSTLSEAREKRSLGMKILIREGSLAKNLNTLFPLLLEDPDNCMFCTDHLYPHHLILGHINLIVKKAIERGMDPIAAITCASKNPIEQYHLDIGLLRVGDPADFIIVEDLSSLRVLESYIHGECVFKEAPLMPRVHSQIVNKFHATTKTLKDFIIPKQPGLIHVIETTNEHPFTKHLQLPPKVENGQVVSDISRDLLKIAVINRYQNAKPSLGFIKGFGLQKGAIASTIAHSAHNIIAVGTTDKDLCAAINALIDHKGGIALSSHGKTDILPLPIAGLMSDLDGEVVARQYSDLLEAAKSFGTFLEDPFIILAFMAFLVSPELKISDRGLFEYNSSSMISLFTK